MTSSPALRRLARLFLLEVPIMFASVAFIALAEVCSAVSALNERSK